MATTHTTHIEQLPHVGRWRVYCDQGCDLGTSATVDDFDAATVRAELHRLAMGGWIW